MEGVHMLMIRLWGNGCIIGNQTKMAGEVIIDDNAIVSGVVLMHQFCHVGGYVMIQEDAVSVRDITLYHCRKMIAYCGINIVGLRRRGFSNELMKNP